MINYHLTALLHGTARECPRTAPGMAARAEDKDVVVDPEMLDFEDWSSEDDEVFGIQLDGLDIRSAGDNAGVASLD